MPFSSVRMLTESFGGAVPVFADNHFRDIFKLRFFIIVIIPVQEQYDIRILFDCAGFAQVAQHRPLIRPFFDFPAQLGSDDDGTSSSRAITFKDLEISDTSLTLLSA